MSFHIQPWSGSTTEKAAIRDIFFKSAERRDFADEKARDQFFERWTSLYLGPVDQAPAPVLVLLATATDASARTLAYLTGCADSQAAINHYADRLPSYAVFADLFARFPAHLHINAAPEARGLGVGSALIATFTRWAHGHGLPGLHIVTSPGQRNVGFYRRNGFQHEVERDWRGSPLLFMGRRLI